MRKLISVMMIFLSGCTITPKDQAWVITKETPNPVGVDGNCLPVAQNLQQLYGGQIAVLSHPDRPGRTHAVLMVENDWLLDNGSLGYSAHWDDVAKNGWRFEYWWRP